MREDTPVITLSHRAHLFAHPDTERDLTAFFTDIFECAATAVPGTSIIAYRFLGGASVSVDFTPDPHGPAAHHRV